MKRNPKVSAIITTHNRISLLPRAINSVLNQTYDNIELIIISDGSTDGTDEFMQKYNDKSNIKFISYYPAKGGNYARNRGILEARGDFIAFLDDDDEWLPEKITKQVLEFEADNSIGLVYTGKNIIYTDKKISYRSISTNKGNPKTDILISNFIGTTSTVMVKRDIAIKCGLFDENLCAQQDYDLWIRICQKCNVASVPEPLINYYNYFKTNQVSDKTALYEQSCKYMDEKYRDLYQQLSMEDYKLHESMNLIHLAQKCMRNKLGKKSRIYLKEAFKKRKSINPILMFIISFFPFEFNLYLHKLKNFIK